MERSVCKSLWQGSQEHFELERQGKIIFIIQELINKCYILKVKQLEREASILGENVMKMESENQVREKKYLSLITSCQGNWFSDLWAVIS